jgi:hypothetical protein
MSVLLLLLKFVLLLLVLVLAKWQTLRLGWMLVHYRLDQLVAQIRLLPSQIVLLRSIRCRWPRVDLAAWLGLGLNLVVVL